MHVVVIIDFGHLKNNTEKNIIFVAIIGLMTSKAVMLPSVPNSMFKFYFKRDFQCYNMTLNNHTDWLSGVKGQKMGQDLKELEGRNQCCF